MQPYLFMIHMPRNCFLRFIYIALLLSVTGCNSDIFVEDIRLPEYSTVILDGDGEEWSTIIPDHLLKLSVDFDPSESEYVHYYTADGYTENPSDDVSEIQYISPSAAYSIGVVGRMIYINATTNATPADIIKNIRLDYGYTTRNIELIINSGQPMSVAWASYDGDPSLYPETEKITRTYSFTNGSGLTQYFKLMPFFESRASRTMEPVQEWARGLLLEMPVFGFNGYQWQQLSFKEVRMGATQYFSPEYFTDGKSIAVPAATKAIVSYTVEYEKAVAYGKAQLLNPTTKGIFDMEFFCTAVYPVNVEIQTSYEQLLP